MCWNAQFAFAHSGLDHDAANPLTIPATVTVIEPVSSLARSLLHCATTRAACIPVCLCRAAGLSLSLNCSAGVSERARSSTAPLRTKRASLSACAERPLPLPQPLYSLGRQRSVRRSNAPSSYRGLVGLEHIYLQHMRACAHRVHATRACLHGHACTSIHMRQPGCSFCKLVGRHTT